MSEEKCESSRDIKERINKARGIQRHRFAEEKIFTNSQMNSRQMKKYCRITEESQELLKAAMDEFGFSARAYDKILKVARTIADLSGQEVINADHISEAIQYRTLDRNLIS
jgi:magnesium chelatase family protein